MTHPPTASSFGKALFFGNIIEEMIYPYPKMDEKQQEVVTLLVDSFRRYAHDNIDPIKIDREHKIPDKVIRDIAEMGLFGMIVPEKYGGSGLSQTAFAKITQEIAEIDVSVALTIGAHQSIGLKGLLLFGTEEQKQKYFPKLASGEMIAGFALTEPEAGSDAASIRTTANFTPDGQHYMINGQKIWITNGGVGSFFTVFTRVPENDPDFKKGKISSFIITRDTPGFSSGKEEEKLGICGTSTTSLFFNNCQVPKENLLGEKGRGFKQAMEILNSGRLGLAAGCLGLAKHTIRLAVAHATERKQFGQKIADFGLIKDKVAHMVINNYAAESMVYMTTALVDRKVPDFSIESAMCKIFASESLWEIVNESLQISAGSGYMKEYPYERALRDSRINLIFEGTNEILRLFVALSGMQGPGEYLKEIGKALKDPIKSLGLLSDFVVKKIKREALGIGDHLHQVHPYLGRQAAWLEQAVRDLANQAEKVLRRHGKEIISKEFAQKRLAEMTMYIYAMICVLSRVSTEIEQKGVGACEYELWIAESFCERARRKIRRNSRAMDKNDDERLKQIASVTYEKAGYSLNIF